MYINCYAKLSVYTHKFTHIGFMSYYHICVLYTISIITHLPTLYIHRIFTYLISCIYHIIYIIHRIHLIYLILYIIYRTQV